MSYPKGYDKLKKTLVILAAAITAAAGALAIVPKAVESSAPAAETLRAVIREYSETISGSGSFTYLGQREITSSLPLVIDSYSVSVGEEVGIGDEIATVDRRSTAALIESMGQVTMLAIPTSNLETAIAMIPETIVSDCIGRVISTAPSGSAIPSGSSVASVARSESLCVMAAISEHDIAKAAVGQRALITLAAYPDEVFSGTVTDIAQTARNQYNGAVLETVVDITVTPDTPDDRIKSGLSADVEIALSDPRDICVVPYAAIGQDGAGEFVYVYEGGRSVRRNITTGAEFADGTEIISGIDKDDIIFKEPDKIAEKSYIRLAEDIE